MKQYVTFHSHPVRLSNNSVRRSPMNFAPSWVVWWASVSNFPCRGALPQKRTLGKHPLSFAITSPPFYENFNNIHSVLVFKSEDKDVIPIKTIKKPINCNKMACCQVNRCCCCIEHSIGVRAMALWLIMIEIALIVTFIQLFPDYLHFLVPINAVGIICHILLFMAVHK